MPTLTIGGKSVEVRFEMLDWYLAGRELGIKFLPWGGTEFWQNGEKMDPDRAIQTDLTILYVALRKHFPGLTLDALAEMIPDTDTWFAATRAAQEALADFFLRAERAARAHTPAADESSPTQPTHGPTSTQ